jgi:hypothetical protein
MIARGIAAALALQLVLAQKADWDPRDDGPDSIDVSDYPAPQQKEYALFRVKCAKCHPVSRPISSQYGATEWKRYMKRMIRRPNSGINEEQAVDLYDFLKYWAGRTSPKGGGER